MKKILVTGVSGFIGTPLLIAICSKYGPENIVAISSKKSELCKTIVYKENQIFLAKEDVYLLNDIQVLIHAGAFTPKNAKAANDILMCNSNISFTEMLLQLPLQNLSKIIYLSTLDVYSAEGVISELTPTLPDTLYGWSKLYCEKMFDVYASEKHLENQILRIGHVYGPGEEKYEKLIPRTINSIETSGFVELWGGGEDLRSFIYIDDVIESIINSIEIDSGIGVINVVGSTPVAIKELLLLLINISKKNVTIIQKNISVKRRDYVFDASKLHKYLLKKETAFGDGLKIEYDYFQGLK